MSKRVTKLFTTKAASIDDDSKSVTFVISTNETDRYGEVVDQKSWNFKSYLNNPLVLWGHSPDEPENVLGQASDLEISKDGKQTTARLTFATDINAKAALVWNMIKRGILRTVSVGFVNHSLEWEEDVPILKDNELLEISVVPIPANSGAVALGLQAGDLNRKDVRWLMDSMRREADLLEEQYKASEPHKEKNVMTPEQATAVIEGMAKITESLEALKAENSSLKEEIAALKPVEETDEQKTEREAAEAKEKEEAEAAVKAEAEKKTAEEEAARKAEQDAKDKEDPAKGGDDDQPGAGDDDTFDEDAEITAEEQAEIDAELEALVAA